jgi:hypothetical protein
LDAQALKALSRAAVALNTSSAARRPESIDDERLAWRRFGDVAPKAHEAPLLDRWPMKPRPLLAGSNEYDLELELWISITDAMKRA